MVALTRAIFIERETELCVISNTTGGLADERATHSITPPNITLTLDLLGAIENRQRLLADRLLVTPDTVSSYDHFSFIIRRNYRHIALFECSRNYCCIEIIVT